MSKHTIGDLHQMQAMPLNAKISMTITRIRGWLDHWDDECYVSFSGGKDSTVLVDIIHNRMGRTDIPLVFVDTGLEYPELRDFVKTYGDRVTWLHPKMNFRQVIEKYGYPFISKEASESIAQAKSYLKRVAAQENYKGDLLSLAKSKDKWEMPYRVSIMLGQFETFWDKKRKGLMPKDGQLSKAKFQQTKWAMMLNAPFDVSNKCCDIMKKEPMHRYQKETGRHPITAQMACESGIRLKKWLTNGCNAFELKEPISNPMSFWTENDVLSYIKSNNLPIASVYGDVIEDTTGSDNIDGQMRFDDLTQDLWTDELKMPKLKTTGCNRTGCMFCGFGCHLEKEGEGRFERMKQTHPKQYEWIMKPWDEGGLGYKQVIDWINDHGNMNIKY